MNESTKKEKPNGSDDDLAITEEMRDSSKNYHSLKRIDVNKKSYTTEDSLLVPIKRKKLNKSSKKAYEGVDDTLDESIRWKKPTSAADLAKEEKDSSKGDRSLKKTNTEESEKSSDGADFPGSLDMSKHPSLKKDSSTSIEPNNNTKKPSEASDDASMSESTKKEKWNSSSAGDLSDTEEGGVSKNYHSLKKIKRKKSYYKSEDYSRPAVPIKRRKLNKSSQLFIKAFEGADDDDVTLLDESSKSQKSNSSSSDDLVKEVVF